jgi:hypothetical protein
VTDDAGVCTKPDPAPAAAETAREPDGKWKRGRSPNPGGKTKAERNLMREVRDLAGRNAPAAIRKLRSIMDNRRAPYQAQIAAACAILDRAVGKPAVPASATLDDGTPAPQLDWDRSLGIDLDRARRIAFVLTLGLRAQEDLQSQHNLIESPSRPGDEKLSE